MRRHRFSGGPADEPSDAELANRLPALHKDPVDRMLIAQALHHAMPIITSDRMFEGYGVSTIW